MGPTLGKDYSLPAMGALPDAVTVSGISGGSYAASQFHVIYSDLVKGAGLIIGGSYGDKPHEGETSYAEEGIELANEYAAEGLIDPLSNLENDPVYIFSGGIDTTVPQIKQRAQETFYENYNANLMWVDDPELAHEIPSLSYVEGHWGHNLYDYDMPKDLLTHVLSNIEFNSISTLNPSSADWQNLGVLRRFNQHEFVDAKPAGRMSGLAKNGYVYYPDACVDGTVENCYVHMHLHGCMDNNQGMSKDSWINYGFVQYAATNNIILLMPQAEVTYFPANGYPCFKSGYILDDEADRDTYLTNTGIQGKAFKAMIERVLEDQDSATYDYNAGNINEYGFFGRMVELNWIRITNWSDYWARAGFMLWNWKMILGLE